LKQLNLSHNKFTGAEVGAFSEMPELELLDLQDNSIKAEYNTLFGRRLPEQLIHLNMSRNRLRGPLGTATAAAVHLEYIALSDNLVTFYIYCILYTHTCIQNYILKKKRKESS
jgi:hypothetical protein